MCTKPIDCSSCDLLQRCSSDEFASRGVCPYSAWRAAIPRRPRPRTDSRNSWSDPGSLIGAMNRRAVS